MGRSGGIVVYREVRTGVWHRNKHAYSRKRKDQYDILCNESVPGQEVTMTWTRDLTLKRLSGWIWYIFWKSTQKHMWGYEEKRGTKVFDLNTWVDGGTTYWNGDYQEEFSLEFVICCIWNLRNV